MTPEDALAVITIHISIGLIMAVDAVARRDYKTPTWRWVAFGTVILICQMLQTVIDTVINAKPERKR